MSYQVGDMIGKYTIIGDLGSGTFGIVYLVEWLGSKGKRQGALKILKDPKFKDILEEVSAWARVSHHRNILTFFVATEYDKQIFLLSECAPDGNLADWIKAHAGKKESLDNAVSLMLGALCGLKELHDNDIVHRDIKPANILLKGATPLLADFGLARGLDLVQSSILAGTLVYMSPELINAYLTRGIGSQRYERTEADDLWASAATLHEMLAGDLPFKSLDAIRFSSPSPLPSHIPNELRDVVEKALQKDISRRFQTVTEMSEALGKAWNDFRQRQAIEQKARQERERKWQEQAEEISVPIPSIAHDTLMILRKLHGDIFVSRWVIKIGEPVKKGDAVVELGTRKGPIMREDPRLRSVFGPGPKTIPVALCAPESGVLVEQKVREGLHLSVDENIGTIRSTRQTIASEWTVGFKFPAYDYTEDSVSKAIIRYREKDAPFIYPGVLVFSGGFGLAGLLAVFFDNFDSLVGFVGFIIAGVIMLLGGITVVMGIVFWAYEKYKFGKFSKVNFEAERYQVEKRMARASHNFYQLTYKELNMNQAYGVQIDVYVNSHGWVRCPECNRSFKRVANSWDGQIHKSCGQKLRILEKDTQQRIAHD